MTDIDLGENEVETDEYRAQFCERDGRVVECTISPVDVPEERLVTTWISAGRGSFVDLAALR